MSYFASLLKRSWTASPAWTRKALPVLSILGVIFSVLTASVNAEPLVSAAPHVEVAGWTHLTITNLPKSIPYDVQRSLDLQTWSPVTTIVSSTGAISIDDDKVGVTARAFYRITASDPVATNPAPAGEIWIAT
ncbi:MAG TPA: hypothetical protein VGM62_19515, partial [Chthoniobacterales bacterium]